jgi:hypothetical protein
VARPAAAAEISPKARIGVIGAGASGLTIAHYLAEAGYEDVTLFERRQRVGGKCSSITIDGQVYEMGAVFGAPCYTLIGDLARRVGLQEAAALPAHYYTPTGRRSRLYSRRRLPALLWQLFVKLAWLTTTQYQGIDQPGLAGIHPDLCQNFQALAQRHGLSELPPLFQPITTGFGYGYAKDVPAAYMLKYLSWPMVISCALGKGYVWPEGIQTLWERLAYEHDVVLGADIQQVVRGDNVLIETAARPYILDYLILACPLDNALSFLDTTVQERDLFSRIRTYDYWVLLSEIEGLPPDIGFIRANFTAKKQGHLMLWYCRCPQNRLFTLYVLGDFQTSADHIEATCAADLRRLGARLGRVRAVRRWRYFPHVNTADMAAGFYEKLEAMQGQRRTFYCGEIMSFSTLECSARYARQLVDRFFHNPTATTKSRAHMPEPMPKPASSLRGDSYGPSSKS